MKTRGEGGGSALGGLGRCLRFVVLEGMFVALAVLVFRLFPAPPEEQTVAKAWFDKGANRVAVQIFAAGFDHRSALDREAPARVVGTVAWLPSMAAGCGRPVYRAIDFTTDTLFTLGLSLWLIVVLFAVLCPLKDVGVRSRIKSVGLSAAVFIVCFIVRCLILGAAAYRVAPYAVVHYWDIPMRVIALSTILIIGFGYLLGDDEDETVTGRNSQGIPVALFIVALDVLVGCNGNLSNNTITVNVGGGGGDILPYLAILVMVAWSACQNFKGGKRAETAVREAGRGGPTVKPDGALKKLTQKDVAKLFGPPCNADMVANWEAFVRTNGARGCTPPIATVGGRTYTYSQGFRTNPTPESMETLGAIVRRFRETTGVQDGIKAGMFVHPRSEETLYRSVRDRPNP